MVCDASRSLEIAANCPISAHRVAGPILCTEQTTAKSAFTCNIYISKEYGPIRGVASGEGGHI